MKRLAWLAVLASGALFLNLAQKTAAASNLQTTPIVATVTGTPSGPMILVPEQVNVRLGPGTDYERVGVLIAGQQAPAVGRSPGGEWIQIFYPGVAGDVAWVYSQLVLLEPPAASLPVVEPPPTATPRVTATIDPTLAAQFVGLGVPATRLPTYTPAPPIVQVTFEPQTTNGTVGFPPILAILGLLVVGMFGMLISVLRGR